MNHLGVVERSDHVVQPVDGRDVGQESVAQASALRGPANKSGNVRHGKMRRNTTGTLPQLTQPFEALIWNWAPRFVGLNGAEGWVAMEEVKKTKVEQTNAKSWRVR
jgi:hypothetical protein